MTLDQLITLVVGIGAALIAVCGATMLYLQQRRDVDRDAVRKAEFSELKNSINNLASMTSSKLDDLKERSDDQGTALKRLSEKTDDLDDAVHGLDKRVGMIELELRSKDPT